MSGKVVRAAEAGRGSGESGELVIAVNAARRRLIGTGSARSLARRTKLDHSYVSKILLGTRRPSLDTAHLLATTLKLSLDEFNKRLRSLWKTQVIAEAAAVASRPKTKTKTKTKRRRPLSTSSPTLRRSTTSHRRSR